MNQPEKVAKNMGLKPELSANVLRLLSEHGVRVAVLPDDQIVIRQTKNIYTHVICGSQDGIKWYVLQWTARPEPVAESWRKARSRITNIVSHPHVRVITIWGGFNA